MILLDSCCVLEILLNGPSAATLSSFLDKEQEKGKTVHTLGLVRLEISAAAAVRYKEGRFPEPLSFDAILAAIDRFPCHSSSIELSKNIIEEASRIKAEYAASMIDCYLIAHARESHSEILTSDPEILGYLPQRARRREAAGKFATVRWR